mgnify:CR=1 FL=1|jgi:tetratricopeptide (TPR) repeat protein
MGLRFRKSIKLAKGVRLNLGAKSSSLSFGGKGHTLNIGSKGMRSTYSLPGTGVSYSTSTGSKPYHKTNYRTTKNNTNIITEKEYPFEDLKNPGCILIVLSLIFAFINSLGWWIFAISLIINFVYKNRPEYKKVKYHNLAVMAYRNAHYNKALEFINKSLNEDRTYIPPKMLFSIICHDKLGRYEDAITTSMTLINGVNANHEDRFMAQIIIADSYMELNDYNNAVREWQKVAENENTLVKKMRYMSLGKCFYYLSQYEAAVEQFKQGPVLRRTFDEDVLEAKYWLGISYFALGDAKKAKTQLAAVYSQNMDYEDVAEYMEKLS